MQICVRFFKLMAISKKLLVLNLQYALKMHHAPQASSIRKNRNVPWAPRDHDDGVSFNLFNGSFESCLPPLVRALKTLRNSYFQAWEMKAVELRG